MDWGGGADCHQGSTCNSGHEQFPCNSRSNGAPIPCGRSTTPQQWEDYSRYNKERADAEMQASNRLREAIHHTLQQTANDLEAQKIATEYAFRRRIHEFERAKDELEWQKKNVSLQEQSWLAVRIPKKHQDLE